MNPHEKVPKYLRYVDELPTSKSQKYIWFIDIEFGGFNKVIQASLKEEGQMTPPRYAIKIKCGDLGITHMDRMEVHALKTLENEENVIRMVDLIRLPKDLMIVMDLAKTDLHSVLIEGNLSITSEEKRTILKQLFNGLAGIHRNKLIHRDIKPSNLLISVEGIIKISDFGSSVPLKIGEKHDTLAGTLCYKALELLMEDEYYDEKVDMWAAGCSMAELWMRRLLFSPEHKNVVKQIEIICKYCGFPSEKEWPRVVTYQHFAQFYTLNRHLKRRRLMVFAWDMMERDSLAVDLFVRLLALNPDDRISATECLTHAYFTRMPSLQQPHLKSLLQRMDQIKASTKYKNC